MLYFVMLVAFVGLIVGPIVAGKKIPSINIPQDLLQPTFANNDTSNAITGTAKGAASVTGAGAAAPTSTSSSSGSGSGNIFNPGAGN